MKLTRSSQSACGISIKDIDASLYNTISLSYTSLTSGPSLDIWVGSLKASNSNASGTLKLDISDITSPINIKINISGQDGSVIINSLVLS